MTRQIYLIAIETYEAFLVQATLTKKRQAAGRRDHILKIQAQYPSAHSFQPNALQQKPKASCAVQKVTSSTNKMNCWFTTTKRQIQVP